jgi:serine/threonine protein kinase/Tfp pilus assembly protein PilF
MPLSTGDKLGPYQIVAPIGAGGMGEVFRAKDPRLNREVAIKISASQFSERFEREAKAIAALNHPNICQIYDIGPNYLVMEFIDGTPLQGPLPLDRAIRYAAQICDALDAAHKKNITHRDLKPANILVTANGVKLLDFGLAKVGAASAAVASDAMAQSLDLTEVGTVLGTASYMSPEQAKGEPTDARSDIFSFGVVLYEMLSGRRAFSKDSAVETMAAIVRDEPAPLDAPSNLSAIVTRCIRKLPASRFQTINEVRAALEQATATPAPTAKTPSIAVLPFANMSADKENEYFSDGLAEEILNLLAKIPGLKVIARTSAFAFKGKEQDIRKIAETLNVGTILEGSVRRAGNRIRVTAQLIEAENGSHLWSERYDRDLTDVFAIQDEIAQAISEALKIRLAPRAQAVNIEAYQNYLKGVYYGFRFTPEGLAKAKGYFEQALAIDPNYAPAYYGLSVYYFVLGVMGIKPVGEMAPLAKSAAEKALDIDPSTSLAHSVLATIAATCEYDWKTAEAHYRKATSTQPVPPRVRYSYAVHYLLPQRRVPEAIEQSRMALETDPLSMTLHWGLVMCMHAAKQYREAIECAHRALEIDASYHPLWIAMGLAQLHASLPQEAIATFKRVVDLAPWYHMGEWLLAAAYHQAGDREHSQEWARKLADSHGQNIGAALYYAAAGEVDAMFDALEGAFRLRDYYMIHIQDLLFFDRYHTDPRYQALLQKMNLV